MLNIILCYWLFGWKKWYVFEYFIWHLGFFQKTKDVYIQKEFKNGPRKKKKKILKIKNQLSTPKCTPEQQQDSWLVSPEHFHNAPGLPSPWRYGAHNQDPTPLSLLRTASFCSKNRGKMPRKPGCFEKCLDWDVGILALILSNPHWAQGS